MRFTKTLAVAMILGMPVAANAEPIAAALSVTFEKCGLLCVPTPATVAVAAASGDSVTASAVASMNNGVAASGALASGTTGSSTDASVTANGSIYETNVVLR